MKTNLTRKEIGQYADMHAELNKEQIINEYIQLGGNPLLDQDEIIYLYKYYIYSGIWYDHDYSIQSFVFHINGYGEYNKKETLFNDLLSHLECCL